jgi:serine/threonine protein kinase
MFVSGVLMHESLVGTGSFGRVRLVKHKKTGRCYALKMLSKALVLKTKQLEHILCEREVLEALSFPFIVNVYATFQDEDYLYLVLEYSIGGEFFTHLRKANRFSNDTVTVHPQRSPLCDVLAPLAVPACAVLARSPSTVRRRASMRRA